MDNKHTRYPTPPDPNASDRADRQAPACYEPPGDDRRDKAMTTGLTSDKLNKTVLTPCVASIWQPQGCGKLAVQQ